MGLDQKLLIVRKTNDYEDLITQETRPDNVRIFSKEDFEGSDLSNISRLFGKCIYINTFDEKSVPESCYIIEVEKELYFRKVYSVQEYLENEGYYSLDNLDYCVIAPEDIPTINKLLNEEYDSSDVTYFDITDYDPDTQAILYWEWY